MENGPLSRLPHGLPFRFIDRVVSIDRGERVVAISNVTANGWPLHGHFPEAPRTPGALLLESMAQAAGMLLPDGSQAFLAQIRDARIHRLVVPGDQLRIEAARLPGLGTLHRFRVTAAVDGRTVAESEIVLAEA